MIGIEIINDGQRGPEAAEELAQIYIDGEHYPHLDKTEVTPADQQDQNPNSSN